MKIIYLIRHAESIANVGGKTSNPESIELTADGERQAKQLAGAISDEPDLIITSPFIRTLQTAEPLLAKFPKSKHEQWTIQEFTYLSPVRCHNTSMEDRIPMAMEYWEKNDPNYCDGGGAESFSGFIGRVTDFKNRIKDRLEEIIVVFSHFQFISAYKWIADIEKSSVDTEDMTEFRQYLFSCKVENAGVLKHIIRK